MATRTLYVLSTAAVTGNSWFSLLQDGGTAPTAATTAFGYAPGKLAVNSFCRSRLGATATSATTSASSFIDTASGPIAGSSATLTGDSFRAGPYTGNFANTSWTFVNNLIATTTGLTGRLRLRVWKSANADGSSATALTASTQTSSSAALTTSAANFGITWASPGVITLTNEYLFFQFEWQEQTSAGGSNADNAFWRQGSSITTPDFVSPAVGTSSGSNTSTATGVAVATRSAVAFSGPRSAVDFRSGTALPPGYSLTRSTTGAYIDSTGTRQFAAIDTPRFNYRSSDNGLTWKNAGLLNGRSSTNYVLKSDTPSSPGNSPWDFIGAPSGTGDTGADGSTAMCRFFTGTNTVQSKWAYQTISVGMGNTYRSVAVDVKPGTWPYIGLAFFSENFSTSVTGQVIFDLSTSPPTVPETYFNNSTLIDGPYIEPLRNGIYRLGFSILCASTPTQNNWRLAHFATNTIANGLTFGFNGDNNGVNHAFNNEYIDFSCAMLTDGPSRPMHIVTTSSAVTSGADFLSATSSGIGMSLSAADGFSVMLEAEADANASAEFLDAQNSTTILAEMQRGTGSADYVTQDVGGSSTSSATYTSSLTSRQRFRWAATFSNTKTSESINGATATTATQTSNLPANPTTFYIGNKSGSTNVADTIFTKLAFYENQISDANLATLSTLDGAVVVTGATLASPAATAVGQAGTPSYIGSAAGSNTATAVGAWLQSGAGSSAGTDTATATGAWLQAGAGSSAGTDTATATGRWLQAGDGSAAGANTATAVGQGVTTGAGSSAGSDTATATGAWLQSGVGSSSGTDTASATAAPIQAKVGASTGANTATATGAWLQSGAGSSSGTDTATATAGPIQAKIGSSTGANTATATGAWLQFGVGSSSGTDTATAAGSSLQAGAGSSAGSDTATATGAWLQSGVGNATGANTASGFAPGVSNVGTSTGTNTAAAIGAWLQSGVGSSTGTDTATAVGSSGAVTDGVGSSVGANIAAAIGAWLQTATGTAIGGNVANAFVAVVEADFSDDFAEDFSGYPGAETGLGEGDFNNDFNDDFAVFHVGQVVYGVAESAGGNIAEAVGSTVVVLPPVYPPTPPIPVKVWHPAQEYHRVQAPRATRIYRHGGTELKRLTPQGMKRRYG